jgi:hypothetical protein
LIFEAAAASSLNSQAQDLVHAVAVFKLGANENVVSTTVRATTPKSVPFNSGQQRAISAGSQKPRPRVKGPLMARPVSLPKPVSSAKPPIAAGGYVEGGTF